MDNQVRIFRKNPIAWWDKNVMRYLRSKYGKDKKTFIILRSIYLALCEIESDFQDTPITAFNKTLGTYAGVSRETSGRYINILKQEGLITKVQLKDPKTNKFLTGTIIEILGIQSTATTSEPLSRYPDIGVSRHRDTPTPLRSISIDKKVSNYKNNVAVKNQKSNKNEDEIEYYARLIADKLEDNKSLSFYKQACRRYNPQELLQKAQEIKADGVAKNPGAVFVSWIKKQEKTDLTFTQQNTI